MASYTVRVEYQVNAYDPESAASIVSQWLMDGVTYNHDINVFDENKDCVYSAGPIGHRYTHEEERE